MKNANTLLLMELAHTYTEVLARAFGERLVSVVVYGSVARGDSTPTSDVDILIVARDLPLSRRARNRILVELEEELTSMIAMLCTDRALSPKSPPSSRPPQRPHNSRLFIWI